MKNALSAVWQEALRFSAIKYAIQIKPGSAFSPVEGVISTPCEAGFMTRKQAE